MARDAELRAHITAKDDASKVIDKVADKADKLDGETATVKVEAPGLDDLTGKLADMPGTLGEVGGLLQGLGSAGGIGAAAAAMGALANHAADMAISAKTTATLTGDTVEDASRLQAVWGQSGADVNDLNDVMLQMNGVLAQQPDLAKQLGVNLNDGKTIGQRFVEVVDALQHSTLSAADKAQLMSSAFGEEGVRQVAKLTTVIDGPLSDAVAGVSDMQVISNDDVDRAQEMKKATAEFSAEMSAAGAEIGRTVMPAITDLVEALNTEVGGKSVIGLLAGAVGNPGSGLAIFTKGVDLAKSFNKEVITGTADWEAINSKAGDTAARTARSTEDQEKAVKAAADANKAAVKEQDALADALEATAKALQEQADALNDQVDAATSAADQQLAVSDSLVAFADALKDSEASTNDQRDAAISLAKATVDLKDKQAEAAGVTLTATQRVDNQNSALLDTAATAKGPARSAILDYIGSVNQIPPEKVTEIQAAIDAGDLDTARRLLDEASAPRKAAVNADANTAAANAELDQAARTRQSTIIANVGKGSGWGIFNQPFGSGFATASFSPSQQASTVVPVTFQLPSAGEIARKIGRVKLPFSVASSLRADERLSGARDL
jgi:uncharacterized FlaG/YvyC family protein